MIEQTGKKWDDEFLTALNDEPGSDMYWRDKLNEYLLEYNRKEIFYWMMIIVKLRDSRNKK